MKHEKVTNNSSEARTPSPWDNLINFSQPNEKPPIPKVSEMSHEEVARFVASMEPVPPPSWNNSHQPREKPLSFNERAGIKIKSASELKKLSPIEQVEQLSIMEEAAFADAGYAVVAGQELIEEILQDNSLPPITHILAQKIEPIMRQDFSEADRGPYAYNPAEQEKSFGYSNIVTPEMIPYSSSDIPLTST